MPLSTLGPAISLNIWAGKKPVQQRLFLGLEQVGR